MYVIAKPAFSKHNPYISLLYNSVRKHGVRVDKFSLKKIIFGHPDIFHIHWVENYLGLTIESKVFAHLKYFLRKLQLIIAKYLGVKIIWTVHNIKSHSNPHPRLEKKALDWFSSILDGAIYLSPSSAFVAQDCYPVLKNKPAFIIPHGHYQDVYPIKEIDQKFARKKLGIPENNKVLLYFGSIKPYKNVPTLIDTFLKCNKNDTLLIAGECESKEIHNEVLTAINGNSRIHFFNRYIDDNEIYLFFSAADFAIFPFKSILNSGSVLLALSLNVPVIAPSLGGLIELSESLPEWVNLYEGGLNCTVLDLFTYSATASNTSKRIDLSLYDWDLIGNKTIDAYESILSS